MSGNNICDNCEMMTNMNSQQVAVKMPSLKINALSNLLTLSANIIVGLLLLPAILAYLGEKRFGIWMLVSSFIGYFGILRFGVGTGVLRYVPLYRGQGDNQKTDEIVSTAMVFYLFTGAVIFAVSYIFAGKIADFFNGGPELTALVQLSGVAAALECPSLIFDAAIRSYEVFWLANLVTIVSAVIRAAALYAAILMGYGLIAMGWIQVALSVVILGANWIAFELSCPDVRLRMGKIGLPILKLLLVYGFIIMLEGAANTLSSQSPKLIVGKVISLEAVGVFGAVWYLMLYYQRFIFSLTRVLMPRFSFLSGRNAHNDIRRLFFLSSRYSTIMAGMIFLLLWTVGPSFLLLWMKSSGIKQGFTALAVLSAGNLVFLSHRISVDLLFGLGKQKQLTVFAAIEAIAVIAGSSVLSYRYGITGVAIGVVVPIALVRGIWQTVYVCRTIGVGFWEYYADSIFKPWAIAIFLAVAAWGFGINRLVDGWLSMFLVSAIIVFAYGVIAYLTVVETQERQELKNSLTTFVKFILDKIVLGFLLVSRKVKNENTSGFYDV